MTRWCAVALSLFVVGCENLELRDDGFAQFSEPTGSTNVEVLDLYFASGPKARSAEENLKVWVPGGKTIPFETSAFSGANGVAGDGTLRLTFGGTGWVVLGLPRELFVTDDQEDLPRNPDHLVMRYLVGRSEPRVSLVTASFETGEYFVTFSEEVRIEVPPEEAVELLADGSPVACRRTAKPLPVTGRRVILTCDEVPDAISVAPVTIFGTATGEPLVYPGADAHALTDALYEPFRGNPDRYGTWIVKEQ